MLTTREMMTALYLAGGLYSAEACAWLHKEDTEADALTLLERTLDTIEGALEAYRDCEADAKATVEHIACVIGFRLQDAGGTRNE